jgi:hypothetical protein
MGGELGVITTAASNEHARVAAGHFARLEQTLLQSLVTHFQPKTLLWVHQLRLSEKDHKQLRVGEVDVFGEATFAYSQLFRAHPCTGYAVQMHPIVHKEHVPIDVFFTFEHLHFLHIYILDRIDRIPARLIDVNNFIQNSGLIERSTQDRRYQLCLCPSVIWYQQLHRCHE